MDERQAAAEVDRLVARHPDTPAWAWVVFLIVGFLLIIPVVLAAFLACALLRVSPALGLVFGTLAWLCLFLLLRQGMLWRRRRKVDAFLDDFEASFPGGEGRESALRHLGSLRRSENAVLSEALSRLGPEKAEGKASAAADPEIDPHVARLLEALERRLRLSGRLQILLGLGIPGAYFVFSGIYVPDQFEGLLLTAFLMLVVWNILLVFIMRLVEVAWLRGSARAFNDLFPAPRRAAALAAFDRLPGCPRARRELRRALMASAGG